MSLIILLRTLFGDGQTKEVLLVATGNPSPSIVWIWQYTGYVLCRCEKLTLTDVDRSQTGAYLCRAWNEIGSNSTGTCSLDLY